MISPLVPILHVMVKVLFMFHNEFSFSGSLSLASELRSGLDLSISNLGLGKNHHLYKTAKKSSWLEVSIYLRICCGSAL